MIFVSFYENRRMDYQLTLDVGRTGRGAVHAAMRKVITATGQTPWPHYALCGTSSEVFIMVKTSADVTCKRCLKHSSHESLSHPPQR